MEVGARTNNQAAPALPVAAAGGSPGLLEKVLVLQARPGYLSHWKKQVEIRVNISVI